MKFKAPIDSVFWASEKMQKQHEEIDRARRFEELTSSEAERECRKIFSKKQHIAYKSYGCPQLSIENILYLMIEAFERGVLNERKKPFLRKSLGKKS
jgi:hypothetical protein